MVENSILFYNWQKVLEDKTSNSNILDILNNLVLTTNPLNKKYRGRSFLIKPKTLLSLKTVTTDEKIQALQVASTRNYFDYWFKGYAGAYLDFCGVSVAQLKHNRLLTIDSKNRLIYLIHEG